MVLEGSIMTDLILREYKVNDIAYKRSPKRIPWLDSMNQKQHVTDSNLGLTLDWLDINWVYVV